MTKKTHPYSVRRVDGHLLQDGKKRKRFKTFDQATDYAVQGVGIGFYIETADTLYSVMRKLPQKIVADGLYIDVPSSSRDDLTHHVYTGDDINSPMCTCEGYHHGTIEPNVLYTCTHIRRIVYGEEK